MHNICCETFDLSVMSIQAVKNHAKSKMLINESKVNTIQSSVPLFFGKSAKFRDQPVTVKRSNDELSQMVFQEKVVIYYQFYITRHFNNLGSRISLSSLFLLFRYKFEYNISLQILLLLKYLR